MAKDVVGVGALMEGGAFRRSPGGDVAGWNFHVGLLSFQCVGRVCLGEMIT